MLASPRETALWTIRGARKRQAVDGLWVTFDESESMYVHASDLPTRPRGGFTAHALNFLPSARVPPTG